MSLSHKNSTNDTLVLHMNLTDYINKAIFDGRDIILEYAKYDGIVSNRRVSNVRISEEYGEGYISGFCHLRNEDRTFKISRIRKIDGKPVSSFSSDANSNIVYTERNVYSNPSKNSIPSSTISREYADVTVKPSTPKSTPVYQPSTSSCNNNSEGCYIATMAYGDYEHPQVMVLRRYRDQILKKSFWGRLFISTYYYLSPKAVYLLKGHDTINAKTRGILDKLIVKINKRHFNN